LNAKLAVLPEALIFAFGPPPLPGYGNVSGFTLQLQDRSGGSLDQLSAQVKQFMAEASKRPEIGRLTTTMNAATPQMRVELDREKARASGVNVDSVFQTLQAYLSGLYVNDFVRFGRVFKVFLQAEPKYTHEPSQIGKFYVRNREGKMVPLDTLVNIQPMSGPNYASRYNLYRAAEISGVPAPGYSSAQALRAIEEVAKGLPREYGYEWSGLTYQERKSEGEAGVIFGMAVVFVFLLLAAQYESWALPFAVLLCTPLVVLGTFVGLIARGYDNNVYVQIGLVMLIGLAAKNAILIVEFAKLKRDQGKPIIEAALEASKLRLRPILMTSLAFIVGCVPLMLSSGSGAVSRGVMGTAVVFGMTIATVVGVFLIPICYVFVQSISELGKKATPDTPAPVPQQSHV
jgi:multidrug efflux pump subunit AcrB